MQVVAVEGVNPNGAQMLVQRVFDDASFTTIPSAPATTTPLCVVVASGPFTEKYICIQKRMIHLSYSVVIQLTMHHCIHYCNSLRAKHPTLSFLYACNDQRLHTYLCL